MSYPPSQQPGSQPPAGWNPPTGNPGNLGNLGNSGYPAPGQAPQGQPGFGGPTGQLVLEMKKPWGSMGMTSAAGRIDGYPASVTWGHNEFTVPAGTRRVDLRAQYLWEYGRAAETVTVQPGQRVELYYTPPAFTFLSGRIGPTPQPVRGRTAAITVFVLLGVIILLCILLPLIFALAD